MSTQTYSLPMRQSMPAVAKPNLTPAELKEVTRQILALRRVSKVSGFNTLNTIVELLSSLSPADLIAVGEELNLKPREVPQQHAQGLKKL
jgi:hypothetical protein